MVPQPGLQLLPEMVSVQVTLVLLAPLTVALNDCCWFTTIVKAEGLTMTVTTLERPPPPHPASVSATDTRLIPILTANFRHFIPTISPALAPSSFPSRAAFFISQ